MALTFEAVAFVQPAPSSTALRGVSHPAAIEASNSAPEAQWRLSGNVYCTVKDVVVALVGSVGVVAVATRRNAARKPRKLDAVACNAQNTDESAAASTRTMNVEIRCGACGEGSATSRRNLASVGIAGLALGVGAGTARAEVAGVPSVITDPFQKGAQRTLMPNQATCEQCAGGGLNDCGTCKGSGQFKAVTTNNQGMYQYVDCPDCLGQGTRVCERCLGTGLPARSMKSLLRQPEATKLRDRLRSQRININNVERVQSEVKEILAEMEVNKKKKAEEAAAGN